MPCKTLQPKPAATIAFRRVPLAAAVASAIAAASAHAQSSTPQLDRVVITADPLERDDLNTLRPVNVLRASALREKESTNLGASIGRELLSVT